MDKKERNSRVVKLYVDNEYNLDRTVSIIETVPELVRAFAGKNIRKSACSILQYEKVWKKIEKPKKEKKDTGPTKKELIAEFCGLLGILPADIPSMLSMKKDEIQMLIDDIQLLCQEEEETTN